MSEPRFLVMKYIPDLHRFEPRNIGVVVWSSGVVGARFLAEINEYGDVDGRSVPAFVVNTGAYRQWVKFWRSQIGAGRVDRYDGRAPVEKTAPEFVDALVETGSGDFLVSEGGILLDEVTESNISEVVDDLYIRMVATAAPNMLTAPPTLEEVVDTTLDEICNSIIDQSSIASDPHFKSGYLVSCALDAGGKIVEQFEFSHAYRNGDLKRLYQRVPLSRQKKTLRKTVHDSAWMFEKIAQNKIAEREQCACLVYATPEHQQDPDVVQSLMVLSSVAKIVNVANRVDALDEFKRLSETIH